MTASFPLFLIPLLPLLGAAFSLLFGKRAGKSVITLVACGSVGGAFLVAANAVYTMATQLPPGGSLTDRFFDAPFIKAGDPEALSAPASCSTICRRCWSSSSPSSAC